jgi:hypothetical protein
VNLQMDHSHIINTLTFVLLEVASKIITSKVLIVTPSVNQKILHMSKIWITSKKRKENFQRWISRFP